MADRLLVNSHYTQGLYKVMLPCVPSHGRYMPCNCCMLAIATRRLRNTTGAAVDPIPDARCINHVLLSMLKL